MIDFNIENLPENLPVFPLEGALLLPKGRLPLNIFEEKYINMTNDALATNSRIIVLTQPNYKFPNKVYSIGCAGKIISFEETTDQRYLITLEGILRCEIKEDIPENGGYRRMKVDFNKFSHDLKNYTHKMERLNFLNILKNYFKIKKISVDWNIINNLDNQSLITDLAMICPFSNEEKQALLEASSLKERADLMIKMLEIGCFEENKSNEKKH